MGTDSKYRPSDYVLIAKARECIVRRIRSHHLPAELDLPAELEACFTEFHTQYDPLVRRFASRCGVPKHELDEASQDAWATILKQFESFDCGAQRGSFRGWLGMQVRRAVIDSFRKRQRARERTAEIDFREFPSDHKEPHELVEANWRAEVIRLALGEFQSYEHADDYKLFYLRKFRGVSIQELAEDSGLSNDVIRQRVFRTFRRFTEFLETRGHCSALLGE